MENAVGREVTIVSASTRPPAPRRGRTALVLASNGGVGAENRAAIEVLRVTLPVRVIFDKVPENLRRAPHLVGLTVIGGPPRYAAPPLELTSRGLG